MSDAPSNDFCDIVVTDKVVAGSRYEVQFQFWEFSLTLAVKDRSFAERILGFIAETKGNPVYRDVCLGGGTFQPMPEKNIDLSASFPGASVVVEKDGEYDDSYVIRVAGPMGSLRFDLRGKRLEAFAEALRDIL